MLNNQKLFIENCNYTKKIFSWIIDEICILIDNSGCRFRYVKPNSSWYMFINFDNYKEELLKINISDSYQLSEYLANTYGIIAVAGQSFNVSGLHLRFALVDIDVNKLPTKEAYTNIFSGFKLLIKFFKGLETS